LRPGRRFDAVIIRTPTIVDAGRLGLLAILFEFIDEGRRVWVVGGGKNRYQFIYAEDLADACVRAMSYAGRGIFNIGSDEVAPLRDVYQRVIDRAGTGARIASLPRLPTLAAMRLAHALGVSPLGPYQYRMIAEDFVFDTTKIKRELSWKPTLTNGEMLSRAFEYYRANRREIHDRTDASAHRRPARMGVIRLLKWVS
jgi:nucleoside-diphosphate-sugar epimerase